MNNKTTVKLGLLLVLISLVSGITMAIRFGFVSFFNGFYGWGVFYTILLIVFTPFVIVGLATFIWNNNQHSDGSPYTKAEIEEEVKRDEWEKQHEIEKATLKENKPKDS